MNDSVGGSPGFRVFLTSRGQHRRASVRRGRSSCHACSKRQSGVRCRATGSCWARSLNYHSRFVIRASLPKLGQLSSSGVQTKLHDCWAAAPREQSGVAWLLLFALGFSTLGEIRLTSIPPLPCRDYVLSYCSGSISTNEFSFNGICNQRLFVR